MKDTNSEFEDMMEEHVSSQEGTSPKPIDSTLPFIPPLKYPVDPQPQTERSPLEAIPHVKQPEELLPESDDPWESSRLPKLRRSPIRMEEEAPAQEAPLTEEHPFESWGSAETTTQETVVPQELTSTQEPQEKTVMEDIEPLEEIQETIPFADPPPEVLEGPTTEGKRLIPQKENEAITKKTADGKRLISSEVSLPDSTALTQNKTASLRQNLLNNGTQKEDAEKQTKIPSTLKRSLINLKEPNIVMEKKVTSLPLEEDNPAPTKRSTTSAFAQAVKEKKESRPLIQLSTPQIQVTQPEEVPVENKDASIYEEAFETDHLPPVYTPPAPEPEEEYSSQEDLPFSQDDPLYDFIESLREPLPTERFSSSFLSKASGDEEEYPEDDFAKLLSSLAEGESTPKNTASIPPSVVAPPPVKETLPPNHPRARAPYKEASPFDIIKSWFDFVKNPPEKLSGEEKQYKMVAKMVGLSCILGFFVMLPQLFTMVGSSSVIATVQLDVNPSILLEVTDKNTVTSVKPLNEEAVLVIGASEFEEQPLEEVLHSLTELLVLFGFLQETSTLLATVEDSKQTRGEELSVEIKGYLDDALHAQAVSAVAVGLWVDPDYKHQENAQSQGVSLGKYVLMYEINQLYSLFSMDDLMEFTQEELYQLYVLGNNSLPIGVDTAVALSRQAVLLSELDTYITKVYTKLLEDTPHYEVLFQTPTKEFLVQIEGFDGTVLNAQEFSAYNMSPDNAVLPIVAKSNAIEHVGVLEIQTSNVSITQDWSKGRLEYIVSFYVNDNRHTVTVLASTGDVLHHQQSVVQTGIVKDMGQSAIQELVFNDAGVTKEQLSSISMNQEVVGNTLFYHLTFWIGNRQYSYEVQGDGTIIFTEYEDFGDTPTEHNSGIISETSAKDIALTHAGVTFSQAKSLAVNMNMEGQYVVTFYVDAVPFYYVLSSTTGDILAYEKEELIQQPSEVEEVPEEVFNDIGEDGAKQVAISASNLKEVMIQSFDITESGSGMDKEYTVSFFFMSTEYIYKISAESGKILDTAVNAPELPPQQVQETPAPAPEQSFEDAQQNFDNFSDIFDQFNTNFSEVYQIS